MVITTPSNMGSMFHKAAAIAAAVTGVVTAPGMTGVLPTAVSAALIGFGGLILTADRIVGDPSVGTPPVKTVTTTDPTGTVISKTTTVAGTAS